MRPRTITVKKLLAVAAVSAVGCSKTEVRQEPPPPVPVAPSAAPEAGAGDAQVASLVELQVELSSLSLEQAIAAGARFRPLCDAQGYPLVGNMARKGPPDTAQPKPVADYCSAVRKQHKP